MTINRPETPIPIKERELAGAEPSEVITYQLTEEERQAVIDKYGPIKKKAKRPPMYSFKRDLEWRERRKSMAEKTLTLEELKKCLAKGMTDEEIAIEYGKNTGMVRRLKGRLEKNESAPDVHETSFSVAKTSSNGINILAIVELQGILDYRICYEKKTVNIQRCRQCVENIRFDEIQQIVKELQELEKVCAGAEGGRR